MNESDKKLEALEAALFVYGEPMPVAKLARILGFQDGEARNLVEELQKKLADRGLALIIHDDAVQLVTKPEFSKLLEDIVKEELAEDLTPAALETLAIIAYAGPVPRSRIDYIRGVNSSFILRNLLLRGLIDRSPDPDRRNAFSYHASFDLLRHLGLEKLEDLPEFARYQELLKKITITSSE